MWALNSQCSYEQTKPTCKATFWSSMEWQRILLRAYFFPVSQSSTRSTVLKPPSAIWRIILYLTTQVDLREVKWTNWNNDQWGMIEADLLPSTVTVLRRQPKVHPIPASFSTTNWDNTKAITSLEILTSKTQSQSPLALCRHWKHPPHFSCPSFP